MSKSSKDEIAARVTDRRGKSGQIGEFIGVPGDLNRELFELLEAHGDRPVWIDWYDVDPWRTGSPSTGRDTYFNVLFRYDDPVDWVGRSDMTGGRYQGEFDRWTDSGYRPRHVESYLSDGQIRYAAIFTPDDDRPWTAYHGLSAAAHQKRFDSLSERGFRPVNVSVVSVAGNRSYTALYEKRDVGSFRLRSALTLGQYQSEFDANLDAGRKPVYLNAYTHRGETRISAIWTQEPAGKLMARHGLTESEYYALHDQLTRRGYVPDVVTGYADGRTHRYAATWRA
jgi:hypothetical protein